MFRTAYVDAVDLKNNGFDFSLSCWSYQDKDKRASCEMPPYFALINS